MLRNSATGLSKNCVPNRENAASWIGSNLDVKRLNRHIAETGLEAAPVALFDGIAALENLSQRAAVDDLLAE